MGKVMEKQARRVMFSEEEDDLAKLRWEKKAIILNIWAMCSHLPSNFVCRQIT